MKLTAYLFFDGNCAEAMRYYEKHLRASVLELLPFAGSPAEAHVPPGSKDKIMHAFLKVGDAELMASDAPQGFEKPQGFSVSVGVEDEKEAERIFAALSDGGVVKMALAETFWAKRFGMCKDRFGVAWMVNCAPAA